MLRRCRTLDHPGTPLMSFNMGDVSASGPFFTYNIVAARTSTQLCSQSVARWTPGLCRRHARLQKWLTSGCSMRAPHRAEDLFQGRKPLRLPPSVGGSVLPRTRLPHETDAAEVEVVRGRCRQHLHMHSTAESYSGAGSCLM